MLKCEELANTHLMIKVLKLLIGKFVESAESEKASLIKRRREN